MGWNAVISNYCLKVDACNVLVSRACQKAQITLESFDEMIKEVYVVYVHYELIQTSIQTSIQTITFPLFNRMKQYIL